MASYDPKTIRVRDGWFVALMEERKVELSSGIILPVETGAEKVTEGAATIIRIPHGTKNDQLDLHEGQRVALRSFLKYANPIPTEEKWPSGASKEYFIMNVDDIIGVLTRDVDIGVFSRPSQHAVESVDDSGNVTMRR